MHFRDIIYMNINPIINTEINNIIQNYIYEEKFKNIESLPLSCFMDGLLNKYYLKDYTINLKKIFLNYNYIFKGISSFYGISLFGIILQLHKDKIDDSLYLKTTKWIDKQIYRYIESLSSSPLSTVDAEFIRGISGIGLYLLKNKDFYMRKDYLNIILDLLINKYRYFSLNNWITEFESLNKFEKSIYKHGYINLGIAHGLTGILCFFIKAYDQGLDRDGLLESIDCITNFLLKNTLEIDKIIYFPAKISVDKINNNSSVNNVYPFSWCHGISSICTVIFQAGIITNNEKYKTKALNIFLNDLKHSNIKKLFISPTVCHGFAGILPSLNFFYNETGLNYFKKSFNSILDILIQFYHCDNSFLDYNFSNKRIIKTINHSSLLTSEESVIIMLISLVNNDHTYLNLLGYYI